MYTSDMTTIVNATQLRQTYASVAKKIRGGKDIAVITKRGRPDLALVDLDHLEDLLEADDKQFQASLRKALREKTYSLDEVFAE